MYNIKQNEENEKIAKAGFTQGEWLLFRYILVYGSSGGSYSALTPKRNYPYLSIFEYVLPNEFDLFKKNIKEPSAKEKEVLNKYYIGTKKSWILNTKLRKGQDLSKEEKQIFNILKDICSVNRCGKHCILKRMVDLNFLSQYDITFDKYEENSARRVLEQIKIN